MSITVLSVGPFDHKAMLGILARSDPDRLKRFADALLAGLGAIEVIHNRTGLVMLPMRDTAQGTAFHLGEVLVAEAHIRANSCTGYGMRRGRDLEAAMAMAVVDLAASMGVELPKIAEFLQSESAEQQAEDHETLRAVEATRVEMETF